MRNLFLAAFACALFIYQPAFADSMRNGLPATNMDSFVYEAAGMADMIYGDEGVYDIPPMFEFTPANRINAGIFARRDQGLTTGHGSYMPCAWGADEFIDPPGEWTLSGNNGGNLGYNGAGAAGTNLTGLENTIVSQQNLLNQTMTDEQHQQQLIAAAKNVLNSQGLTAQQYAQAQATLNQAQAQLAADQAVEAQQAATLNQSDQVFNNAAENAEGSPF